MSFQPSLSTVSCVQIMHSAILKLTSSLFHRPSNFFRHIFEFSISSYNQSAITFNAKTSAYGTFKNTPGVSILYHTGYFTAVGLWVSFGEPPALCSFSLSQSPNHPYQNNSQSCISDINIFPQSGNPFLHAAVVKELFTLKEWPPPRIFPCC